MELGDSKNWQKARKEIQEDGWEPRQLSGAQEWSRDDGLRTLPPLDFVTGDTPSLQPPVPGNSPAGSLPPLGRCISCDINPSTPSFLHIPSWESKEFTPVTGHSLAGQCW